MMMFLTEIKAVSSTGQELYFDGPIVKAGSIQEAEEKAVLMNPNLKVLGQYMGYAGSFNDLELS